MSHSPSRIEEKIRAGWLGKVIGGTLGGPFEGIASKLSLDFYDPVPSEALPNDDLDLQVVWLHHLLKAGSTEVRTNDLAQAWQRHVSFPWCEYAVGLRNLAYGIEGDRIGSFDNWWAEGMGAAIRTEVWAFSAPGAPRRAAHRAWADSVFDHAGDGVHAAVFFAALESEAFTTGDLDTLLDKGLAAVPPASRTAFAVRRARHLWTEMRDWEAVRESLLVDLASIHFTETPINVAFTVLGLLAGEGDFGKTICIATNCGWDTDCTAATAGAILGILDPSSIPAKWSDPIGGRVLLNKQILDMPLETTLDALTEQTLRLGRQLEKEPERPLPAVAPRRRATAKDSPIRVPYRFRTLDRPLASVDAPASPGEPFESAGHWLRHDVGSIGAETVQFTFELSLDRDLPVRLMPYTPRLCRAFVDGSPYATFEPRDWAPGWHGPSAHLYAERDRALNRPQRAPALPLKQGTHRLDIVIDHDGTNESEIVAGVADAASDLWLPYAIAVKK